MENQDVIKEDLNQIKLFFSENKINYTAEIKEENQYALEFSIDIESYVSETQKENTFHFKLILKENVDSSNIREIHVVKGHIPFHPNFKIIRKISLPQAQKKSQWMGFLDKQDSIVDYVKRMIMSLQFYNDFIGDKIVNRKAYDWYTTKLDKEPDSFPTGTFLIQEPSRTEHTDTGQKNFKIEENAPSKKRKFTITDKTTYTLEEKKIENFKFKIEDDLSIVNPNSETNSKLFITAKAKQQIWDHISWGNLQTRSNRNEQGGILLGKVYVDKEKQLQYGIVEHAIAGTSAKGNPTYLEMTQETWSQMLKNADDIIDNEVYPNFQLIGWYHTHPNHLDVYMSGTDVNTQTQFFYQDWHYAIVLNPHRKIWKAFVGKEALPCDGHILKEKGADEIDEDEKKNSNNIARTSKQKHFLKIIVGLVFVVILGFTFFQKEDIQEIGENASQSDNSTFINKQKTKIGPDNKFISAIEIRNFINTIKSDSIITISEIAFRTKDSCLFYENTTTLNIQTHLMPIDSTLNKMYDFIGYIYKKNE